MTKQPSLASDYERRTTDWLNDCWFPPRAPADSRVAEFERQTPGGAQHQGPAAEQVQYFGGGDRSTGSPSARRAWHGDGVQRSAADSHDLRRDRASLEDSSRGRVHRSRDGL